jgi:hypothetical protein
VGPGAWRCASTRPGIDRGVARRWRRDACGVAAAVDGGQRGAGGVDPWADKTWVEVREREVQVVLQ